MHEDVKRTNAVQYKTNNVGPAHELFQCALAAVQSEQKSSCKPERINTTSIWYPLDTQNSWIFATTQEITLSYVCGDERGKIQVHNNGILTMNADCIARSPVATQQGHPALRSTIGKKPATIITHSFQSPIQERQQYTTIRSNTTSNLNHLQGEVHQLQEQLDRGDSEATKNTQVNYVKPISITAGLVILLLLAAIGLVIRKGKQTRICQQENVAEQSVTSPIPMSRVKTLTTTEQ